MSLTYDRNGGKIAEKSSGKCDRDSNGSQKRSLVGIVLLAAMMDFLSRAALARVRALTPSGVHGSWPHVFRNALANGWTMESLMLCEEKPCEVSF